jgi:hypothetical protein
MLREPPPQQPEPIQATTTIFNIVALDPGRRPDIHRAQRRTIPEKKPTNAYPPNIGHSTSEITCRS